MSHGLILLIVLCIVIVGIWVWINTLLIRKSEVHAPTEATEVGGTSLHDEHETGTVPNPSAEEHTFSMDESAPATMAQTSPVFSQGPTSSAFTPNQDSATINSAESDSVPIEVMEPPSVDRQRVFSRPALPFLLNDAQVPIFTEEPWRRSFYRLTEDRRVLGWIAFHGDYVGASDHAYDDSLLEVLRSYRRSVEKLRREVGLSDVSETTVVGGEGKVWLLTALPDVWFALFLDADTDLRGLSEEVFAEVRSHGLIDRPPHAF